MKKLIEILKVTARKGQSLVEYGLILALVSVVAITVLNTMGRSIKDTVNSVNGQLQSAQTTSSQAASGS